MNSDTISRQAAIDEIEKWFFNLNDKRTMGEVLKDLPPVQSEIIHCKDCKWWDKYSDTRGYCLAAKYGYWSGHWEIRIRRIYDADWYCADAERREQKLQYADEETAQSGLMGAT